MKTIEDLRKESIQELTVLVNEVFSKADELSDVYIRTRLDGNKTIFLFGKYKAYTAMEEGVINRCVMDYENEYYGIGISDDNVPFLVLSDMDRDTYWGITYFSTATVIQLINKLKKYLEK